eukprot:4177272-Prymnesium_polylepis.1
MRVTERRSSSADSTDLPVPPPPIIQKSRGASGASSQVPISVNAHSRVPTRCCESFSHHSVEKLCGVRPCAGSRCSGPSAGHTREKLSMNSSRLCETRRVAGDRTRGNTPRGGTSRARGHYLAAGRLRWIHGYKAVTAR